MNILKKILGTKSERDTKNLQPMVDEINAIYETLSGKSNDDLVARTIAMRNETISKVEGCDKLIDEHLKNWEFSRIALLDKLIMRIGQGNMQTSHGPILACCWPGNHVGNDSIRCAADWRDRFAQRQSDRNENG